MPCCHYLYCSFSACPCLLFCAQVRESYTKVVDGVLFGVRGVKLLFQDIGSAGKLFWRAVRGEALSVARACMVGGCAASSCTPCDADGAAAAAAATAALLLRLPLLTSQPLVPLLVLPRRRHSEAARGAGAAAHRARHPQLCALHNHSDHPADACGALPVLFLCWRSSLCVWSGGEGRL